MNTNTVIIPKEKLLNTLWTNRAEHRKIVDAALVKYQEAVNKELKKMAKRARKGKRVPHNFLNFLPVPQDYTTAFDQAIQQVEWDVREEIELTREDFNRFIRNEWEWANMFAASSARYV